MMKKLSVTALTLLLLLLLGACSTPEPVVEESAAVAVSQADDAQAPDAAPAVTDDDSADANSDAMMEEESHDAAMDDEAMADDDMMAEADHGGDDDMADGGDEMMAEDEMMVEDDSAESMADDSADAPMADLPAWQTMALRDARTGETFTLADFSGKTVFVETMATWCSNCRRQLNNVRDAYTQLNSDNVVFLALSLETNLSDTALADYANSAQYDWTFAVLSPEMLQALASQFGQTITNAPSTPHFIVRPDGSYTDLVTGIDTAPELLTQLAANGLDG